MSVKRQLCNLWTAKKKSSNKRLGGKISVSSRNQTPSFLVSQCLLCLLNNVGPGNSIDFLIIHVKKLGCIRATKMGI